MILANLPVKRWAAQAWKCSVETKEKVKEDPGVLGELHSLLILASLTLLTEIFCPKCQRSIYSGKGSCWKSIKKPQREQSGRDQDHLTDKGEEKRPQWPKTPLVVFYQGDRGTEGQREAVMWTPKYWKPPQPPGFMDWAKTFIGGSVVELISRNTSVLIKNSKWSERNWLSGETDGGMPGWYPESLWTNPKKKTSRRRLERWGREATDLTLRHQPSLSSAFYSSVSWGTEGTKCETATLVLTRVSFSQHQDINHLWCSRESSVLLLWNTRSPFQAANELAAPDRR